MPVRALLKHLYHQLLTLSSGGRGVRKRAPDGSEFFLNPAYRYIDWNPIECGAYQKHIRAGDTVLDIGANAGGYSILFGRWVGAQGRVFAFEPAKLAFEGLVKNVDANGLSGVVMPVCAAVSSEQGTVRFLADGFQGTNRIMHSSESSSAAVQEVPTVTVDEFCAERQIRPTFLKIDTEGYELAVLQGARETIRNGGSRLVLFVELHPGMWARQGLERKDIEAELDRQNLKITWAPEGVNPWLEDSGITVEIRANA